MVLAEKFPASLLKDTAPESIPDGKTPDAYGMGIDKTGWLYADSSPSSGAVWNGIATASSPTSTPLTGTAYWRFAHNRLWGYQTTTNSVSYGAYGYDSNYILDGLGYIPCDYESSNTVNVIPFGDNVAVCKSDCLYIIRNANNPGNGFVAEYVKQASGLPVTLDAIAVDKLFCWANTHGIWALDGSQIIELTAAVRNTLAPFVSSGITSLRADFQKRRVIGYTSATQFIVELGQDAGLYDYSTSGFRFTSRTLVGEEGEPLLIDKIGFIYQYSTSEMATLGIQVKINDTWKDEDQKKIRPTGDNGRCEIALSNALACRKFAIRITGMSAGLHISKILVHVKQGGVLGYSTK